MNSRIGLIMPWVVTLLVPLAILMFGVRLLLTPAFLPIEYNMPGFPPDTYGFTTEDRIRWATPSLIYLINDRGIDYLGSLALDPSTGSGQAPSTGSGQATGAPIYNSRELEHMLDVKNVLQKLLEVWDVSMLALIALGFWAWRGGWLEAYRAGWRRGGFLMVGLLAAFAVFAVTSFWEFFSWFHSLFFQGTSWQFAYSDTLIRLFPMRFWQDCFIYIGAFSLLVGLALAFGLKPKPQ